MIDLLSYTTMDLHAAWPVGRSSSRLLGVCVSSSSSNVMSRFVSARRAPSWRCEAVATLAHGSLERRSQCTGLMTMASAVACATTSPAAARASRSE